MVDELHPETRLRWGEALPPSALEWVWLAVLMFVVPRVQRSEPRRAVA